MLMDKNENGLNFFTTILGIISILTGLFFMAVIFIMQGFYLVLFGILFIIFGIALLNKKVYKMLLFFGIIPITVLFSFQIIMMGISKTIPKYYHTPLGVGLIIISPFWFVVLGSVYLWKKIRGRRLFDKMTILYLICFTFGLIAFLLLLYYTAPVRCRKIF